MRSWAELNGPKLSPAAGSFFARRMLVPTETVVRRSSSVTVTI